MPTHNNTYIFLYLLMNFVPCEEHETTRIENEIH